ncbi:hypothetical protein VNO77_19122 [Canavalia gladiata]|uniref:Uncharacterized protein n=1 Tax=Canavalia gladiata TaxID=3824 RepID=A0AAN9QI89_CANGL
MVLCTKSQNATTHLVPSLSIERTPGENGGIQRRGVICELNRELLEAALDLSDHFRGNRPSLGPLTILEAREGENNFGELARSHRFPIPQAGLLGSKEGECSIDISYTVGYSLNDSSLMFQNLDFESLDLVGKLNQVAEHDHRVESDILLSHGSTRVQPSHPKDLHKPGATTKRCFKQRMPITIHAHPMNRVSFCLCLLLILLAA